eukprot:2392092-Pyramimonas_sp.AAC.1
MQNVNIKESWSRAPELENKFERQPSVRWVEGLGSIEERVTKGSTVPSLPSKAVFRSRRLNGTCETTADTHRDLWNNNRAMVRAYFDIINDGRNSDDAAALVTIDCSTSPPSNVDL